MPRMPDSERALVELQKLTDCLVNPLHREGASKARVFIAFGFSPARPEELKRALLAHAQSENATEVASIFGSAIR